jgi:hypothetical protein
MSVVFWIFTIARWPEVVDLPDYPLYRYLLIFGLDELLTEGCT